MYFDLLRIGQVKDDDLQPDLYGAQHLVEAFFELSTERQIGNSLGPIPVTAIWAYDHRYQAGGEGFIATIHYLDRAFLRRRASDNG